MSEQPNIIEEFLNKKKKLASNIKLQEHLSALVAEPPLKKRPCTCAICKKNNGSKWLKVEKQSTETICGAIQNHYGIRSNRKVEGLQNLEEITNKFKEICKENISFKWVCDKCEKQ